jgi:hypothetical protein
MQFLALIVFTFLIQFLSYSQITDTTKVMDSKIGVPALPLQKQPALSIKSGASEKWRMITRGDVIFKSTSFILTDYENKILDLESRECKALRQRDSITLIMLWGRDFTLDEKQDKLLPSKNGLPYYATLWRTIESITPIDSMTVYSSGFEVSQRIEVGLQVDSVQTKRFLHIWRQRNGIWKLSSKETY